MLGAIVGDIVGSIYETFNTKRTDFPLFSKLSGFTDDSVLTIAVAEALVDGMGGSSDGYIDYFHKWVKRYPLAGYGPRFTLWAALKQRAPYNSWGNGSAMRVSPVAYAFDSLDDVLREAEFSASVTHNHPEGIRGAKAVAGCVYMARTGASKNDIRAWVTHTIGYDISRTVDEIRPNYRFHMSCQDSVPQAITAFLESESFEDGVRKAVSLGGDSDTIAAIAGSIAEPFYGGVPEDIKSVALGKLTEPMLAVIDRFGGMYSTTPCPTAQINEHYR